MRIFISGRSYKAEERNCLVCGNSFITRLYKKTKFCSFECSNSRLRDGQGLKKRIQKVSVEKSRARSAAKRHIKITTESICKRCGNKAELRNRLERHHPDYSQPLKVEILCEDCHNLER